MPRRYRILDVFTDRPLTGNPLAVVLDCDGLDTQAMQSIAREFNLSETVFLLPPADDVNLARLRIFTPRRELPFAGHPTVGTAVQLAIENAVGFREDINFLVEEQVGLVPCTVRLMDTGKGRARFELPKLPERLPWNFDRSDVAAALSLEPGDIGCGDYVPARFSAGVPFYYVPLSDLDAVARARPDMSRWNNVFDAAAPEIYVYTKGGREEGASYHARMFAPSMGIAEDPATGAAAAGFAGVVQATERPGDGEHTYVIEQGYEMGRPSRIVLSLIIENRALTAATIGGHAVVVASGELHV
ncbi:phenazine biosynthesis protein PhzF [Agaricicola taiwanensis]|uniref:Phenazine biosynthesis protein PhzF n=1 Tax=Agaricicola taiwanensis TaxID=591372 RepID=A0A8J2YHE1_9RHOB|nr:PhzF family phenazine biosynthesis protein [Agaricicola taiwanensis]GGE42731.1 phenazine biosynthesis protein PhzF [Agaricicola taiwanensis]